MEQWEKDYVVKSLDKLIENTFCNASLLAALQSQGILARVDIEKLNALKNSEGEIRQSYHLYTLLQSRTNAYQKLIKALLECRQSGALKILLNGFRLQGITSPLLHCDINIDYEDILQSHVIFQAQTDRLSKLFGEVNEETLQLAFIDGQCEDDYIDIFLVGNKRLVLATNTIPDPPSIYIPRYISNLQQLNPAIFKQNCQDIFVFKDIERTKLTKLAAPNTTSTSSIQILELNSRFILLDDEVDWDEIQTLANEQSCPVHLVKYEESPNTEGEIHPVYILEGTTGSSNVLWKFVEKQQNRSYISENEFLTRIEVKVNSTGVCICDTPGMGKSWLLANLARNVVQRHPDRLVAFIPFSSLSQKINSENGNSLSILLEQLSPTYLSRAILRQVILTGSLKMELFFDGLDEVSTDDLDMTKRFLKSMIESTENVKIYVTARPQLRRELESTLGVVAYNLLPFSKGNQLEYLVKSWQNINPKSDEGKLQKFASACLKGLKNALTVQDKDIMGIPLQCYLLGQVYAKEARLYSNPKKNLHTPNFKSITVHEMYKRFIDLRFDYEEKPYREYNEPSEELASKISKMKCYHVWAALNLLYPEVAEMYGEYYQVDTKASYLSFGILETHHNADNDTIDFIHRTIAEFLVAEYFVEVLLSKSSQENNSEREKLNKCIRSCFVEKILLGMTIDLVKYYRGKQYAFEYFKFQSSVMTYFINERLSVEPEEDMVQKLGIMMEEIIGPSRGFRILQSAISQNCANLLRYIKHIFKTFKPSTLKIHQEYLVNTKERIAPGLEEFLQPVCILLCTASHFSTSSMVAEIFNLFEDCFHYDPALLCQQIPKANLTPLHPALRRGNYELVEILLEKHSLEWRSSLYWCLEDTNEEPEQIINKRIQISKLLLGRDLDILHEANDMGGTTYTSPIVAQNVHLDLIKFLVQEGADLFATRHCGEISQTIILTAVEYMNPTDYLELCRFLFQDVNAFDLLEPNNNCLYSLLEPTIEYCPTATTKKIQNSNLTERKDIHGDIQILSIVRQDHDIPKIMKLIKCGTDPKFRDHKGKTMLHLAAKNGNVQHIDYFTSLGLSLEATDSKGRTAIHYSLQHLETLKGLIRRGANILALDNSGNNVAHLAARKLSEEKLRAFVIALIDIHPEKHVFNGKNIYGRIPLQERLRMKNMEIHVNLLTLLLQDLESKDNLDHCGENLFVSAVIGKKSIHILNHLVDHGVDTRAENIYGKSALHIAAENGDVEVFEYLLSLGLSITYRCMEGKTPLLYTGGNLELINQPITAGADLYDTDKNGNNLTHLGAEIVSSDDFKALVSHILQQDKHNILLTKANKSDQTSLQIRLASGMDIDNDTLDSLLKLPGVDVNAIDSKFYSTFHLAVKGKQRVDVLKRLLEYGAKYHEAFDRNSLLTAVQVGQPDIVHFLLYLDKEGRHLDKRRALEEAIRRLNSINKLSTGKPTVIEEGINRLEIYLTLLPEESGNHRFPMLAGRQTAGGESLNNTTNDNPADAETTLDQFICNVKGSSQDIKQLLSKMFRFQNIIRIINTRYSKQGLDTSESCLVFRVNILQQLVELGLNIFKKDPRGSAFIYRVSNVLTPTEYHELLKFLIRKELGSSLEIVNDLGLTPFHLAVYNMEVLPETLELLYCRHDTNNDCTVENCNDLILDPNAIDANGHSILHWALKGKRSVEFIQRLVGIGANVKARYGDNGNLAHYAASMGLHDQLKFFIQVGCEINEEDGDGNNVLQCAVASTSSSSIFQMVLLIVGLGVDKTHVNKEGKTASEIAIEKGISDDRILNALVSIQYRLLNNLNLITSNHLHFTI